MPTALRDVRSQGQSGKHLLSLSFSGFDPNRTLVLIRDKKVRDPFSPALTSDS
jgi:hypothetical protein